MRVRPGQRLRIKAADWNDMLAAAAAYKASPFGNSQELGLWSLPPGWVWLKNTTGSDRARFEILGLGDPVFTQSDNAREFYNRISFDGDTVAFASHFGKFAVLQEPIRAGKLGKAMVLGVTNVKIDVQATAHEFADIENAASDTLRSYTGGSARILWKAAGTGEQWARVLLGACHVKLWRFTLNADFSGSPSSAAADLLNMDGTDSGADITVYDYLNVFSADLANGDAGYCVQQGLTFHAIQAPCPT